MGYYICGYSDSKIIISKQLQKIKCKTDLDNKIYFNKITSKSIFDLSILLNNSEDYNIFIVYSKNSSNIYKYLINLQNNKQQNINLDTNKKNKNLDTNINIFTKFILSYNDINYIHEKFYYKILRKYPYNIIIYNILIQYIPEEIIIIILKILESEIFISFKINKSTREKKYFLWFPYIYY